jgi:hypothetical protein
MDSRRKRARRRLGAAIAVVAGLAASIGVIAVGGGSVDAAPVSLTLDYSCVFPLIGAQPVAVVIHSDMPSQVAAGTPTGAFQIDAVSTVSDTARVGLRTVGATTLDGTVKAAAHMSAPGVDLPLTVDMGIPTAPVPAASGSFTVDAHGTTPSLTFTAANAGTATITVGDLVLTLTPKDANGNPTGLGTFDSDCTVVAGQNQVLHTFTITGGGGGSTTTTAPSGSTTTAPSTTTTTAPPSKLHFDFDLSGSSFIEAANGTTPLTGTIGADFDLATGRHTSKLTLDPATGNFTVLGFLPVTANIEFVPVGDTTGSLVDGKLTSHSEMLVKLPNVLLFGLLPISGGPACQTTTPATIDLATPAGEVFDPLHGGHLSGTYTLPGLVAGDCGFLGDIVSLFMAGPDNTIDLTLTAAPAA